MVLLIFAMMKLLTGLIALMLTLKLCHDQVELKAAHDQEELKTALDLVGPRAVLAQSLMV